MSATIDPINYVAATILIVLGLLLLKHYRLAYGNLWFLAFSGGVMAYIMRIFLTDIHFPLAHVFNGIEYFTPVLFLICLRANFEDNFRLGYIEKCALGYSSLFYLVFMMGGPADHMGIFDPPWILHFLQGQYFVGAFCVLFAYWCLFRNWSDDLVHKRRFARSLVMFGSGPTIVVCLVLYFMSVHGMRVGNDYANLVLSSSIIIHCLVIILFFLEVNLDSRDPELNKELSHLTADTKPALHSSSPDEEVDLPSRQEFQLELKKIKELMLEQCVYRDMNLNLAALAQKAGAPEYRMRKAINQELGYRNFYAFLNHYRVAEAKALLSDPTNNDTILKVSMDVGYKNLSTFNKAFRESSGLTPSEFRKSDA